MWNPAYLSFLLLLIPITALSQTDTLVWREGIQLQAEDFKKNSLEHNLDISYSFDYQLVPASFYRWRPIFRAAANFNRTNSSTGDNTTKSELQYAQIIFDIYGLHVRRLELKILEMGLLQGYIFYARDQLSEILRQEDAALTAELDRFMKDLSVAANNLEAPDRVFAEWEQKIKRGLEALPVVKIEDRDADWGVGVYIGAGRTWFSGRTKEHFSNPTSFQFGFVFDLKKRSRLGVDAQMGPNRSNRDFARRGDWPEGLRTSWTGINFTYGFKIPLAQKLLLVPFAGLGINEFSPQKPDREDKRRITGYSPVLGLEFNHFFAGFKTSPREHARLYYKCRLVYNPSNFVGEIGAPQLNFSLSLGLDALQRKVRMIAVPRKSP